ncbi:MAG: hypothetical protein FWF82_02350 [Oscillospiraceae bacterium]|nr:hypothetical protein [Oscillospiraceae bacterium]
MKLSYNVSGAERKPLVKAIGEFLGEKPMYQGVPSMAYRIGEVHVSRMGEITGAITPELVQALSSAGFTAENADKIETPEVAESDNGADTITVELLKDDMTDDKVQNVLKLAESRHSLITKSLGSPLIVNDTGDTLQFVFPHSDEVGIANVYGQFAAALTEYGKKCKRVSGSEKETKSEKFTMRTFLLKFGMIGSEYSACRKYFMRNLTGNACFSDNTKYTAHCENRKTLTATT